MSKDIRLDPRLCMAFLLPLVLSAIPVAAQTRIWVGPQAGINLSSGAYNADGGPFKFGSHVGLEAGLNGTIIYKHWGIQPALLYTQTGFSLTENSQSPNPYGMGNQVVNNQLIYKLNYLKIPINALYAQHIDGQGFQFIAGGYISRLLGGNLSYSYLLSRPDYTYSDNGNRKVKPSNEYSNDGYAHFQTIDAGLQFGVAYCYKNAVLKLGYSLGLTNTWVPKDAGTSYKNNNFSASISYLFHNK